MENIPVEENLEQKVKRVQHSVRDALNTVYPYIFIGRITDSDEDMRQKLKDNIEKHPLIPFMDHIKEAFPKTAKAEIDTYYPEFESRINNIITRLQAPDVTREELERLFDDISEYTKL